MVVWGAVRFVRFGSIALVHEDEVEVILNLVPIFYRHSFTRQVHVIKRKELREKKRNH